MDISSKLEMKLSDKYNSDRIFEIIINTNKFRSVSTINKEKFEEIVNRHIIFYLNKDLGKYKFINYKDNKVEYIILSVKNYLKLLYRIIYLIYFLNL